MAWLDCGGRWRWCCKKTLGRCEKSPPESLSREVPDASMLERVRLQSASGCRTFFAGAVTLLPEALKQVAFVRNCGGSQGLRSGNILPAGFTEKIEESSQL